MTDVKTSELAYLPDESGELAPARALPVKLFFRVMDLLEGDRLWVHCAKNMRVSCFIYLWQKHSLQLPEHEAKQPMERIWQPTGVWQQLIQVETFSN